MKAKFKQAVMIDGSNFKLGDHEIPANIKAHPHFHHYVKCGWIEIEKEEEAAKSAPAEVEPSPIEEKVEPKSKYPKRKG